MTRRSPEKAVKLVPTMVSGTEWTPGPLVLDSAPEDSLPSPPRRSSFVPGDLLALSKLIDHQLHGREEVRERLLSLARWTAGGSSLGWLGASMCLLHSFIRQEFMKHLSVPASVLGSGPGWLRTWWKGPVVCAGVDD